MTSIKSNKNKITISQDDNITVVMLFTGWQVANVATFTDDSDAEAHADRLQSQTGKEIVDRRIS